MGKYKVAVTRRKRQTFTFQTKYETLEKIRKGAKIKDLAEELQTTPSTISTWKKEETSKRIMEEVESGVNPQRAKIRSSPDSILDKALLIDIKQWRAEHGGSMVLTGPIMFDMAQKLGIANGDPKYSPSESSLARFRKKWQIVYRRVCGDGFKAPDAKQWKDLVLKRYLDK